MLYCEHALILISAYLLGCVSTGYYLTLLCTGRNIRQLASGSTGARNVGRVLGRWGFVSTLAIDFSKGVLAVWMTHAFDMPVWFTMLCVLALMAGHIWPLQLCLRGGKGAAITLGALLAFDWRMLLCVGLAFAAAMLVSRRYIISALTAMLPVPLYAALFGHRIETVSGFAAVSILIFLTHRTNLRREQHTLQIAGTHP